MSPAGIMIGANGRLVGCRSCGTKNNVPAYTFRRLPWCGNCGAALNEPLRTTVTRRLYQARHLIMIVAGLGSLWVWEATIPLIGFSKLAASTTPSKDVCATRPQPNQGTYARYTRQRDVAPLTLRTESGSNYFVKIDDAVSGRPVLSFYVYGGSSLEAQVPRGSFVLKYATGSNWCGDRELFGASTETNKADRIFQFDDDHEYTSELIARRNGNLPTKRISREAF
jgi:hypothetical protein